jgi:hypothetical protein
LNGNKLQILIKLRIKICKNDGIGSVSIFSVRSLNNSVTFASQKLLTVEMKAKIKDNKIEKIENI